MPLEAPVMRQCPSRGNYCSCSCPFCFERKLLKLSALCASALNGLGGCPVCGPISVAEDLFTRMRCELDHDRSARYTEQLGADVDDCPASRQSLFRGAPAAN